MIATLKGKSPRINRCTSGVLNFCTPVEVLDSGSGTEGFEALLEDEDLRESHEDQVLRGVRLGLLAVVGGDSEPGMLGVRRAGKPTASWLIPTSA